MVLIIDTSQTTSIEIKIKRGKEVVARKKSEAKFRQSEKLLPLIAETLKKADLSLVDITEIRVAVTGETFTGLRIGVVTANALGYGLGVPVKSLNKKGRIQPSYRIRKQDFDLAVPQYNRSPNITFKKE